MDNSKDKNINFIKGFYGQKTWFGILADSFIVKEANYSLPTSSVTFFAKNSPQGSGVYKGEDPRPVCYQFHFVLHLHLLLQAQDDLIFL